MAKHEEYLWKDPFHHESPRGAVLLSDEIDFLATEMELVHPFEPKLLRPAAYDIRVGPTYYVDDKRYELAEHGSFTIPANGLAYVRSLERFTIPYYLVARYSLRVQQVYRGLLIDNGLHIDPGYTGVIWIPVHNFTTEPRTLYYGQEFISVEFNRTTPLPRTVHDFNSEDELVSAGLGGRLVGSHGKPIQIFYKDKSSYDKRHTELIPPIFWNKFPGERHESGVLGIARQAQDAQRQTSSQLTSFRNIGLVGAAGLILAVLGIVLPICYGRIGGIADSAAQLKSESAELKTEVSSLLQQLQQQRAQIDALSAMAKRQVSSPPSANKGR